jgi:hypothetical protein
MHNTFTDRGLGNALVPPTDHDPCAGERLRACESDIAEKMWAAEALLRSYWHERRRDPCPDCGRFVEFGEACETCGEVAPE